MAAHRTSFVALALVSTACSDDGRATASSADVTSGALETSSSTSSSGGGTSSSTTAATASTSSGTDAATSDAPIFDLGVIPDGAGVMPIPPSDIAVVVTADNAYAFGYGTEAAMSNYYGGIANNSSGDIFDCATGPEQYTVPKQDVAEYLYIVAYADTSVTQGVLGQFRRISDEPDGTPGAAVYTGTEDWEVCATGVDYDLPSPAPSLEVVNAQIEICNDGSGDPSTTSAGWVGSDGTDAGALAVGELNDTPYGPGIVPGNEFPLVCDTLVDAEARWMWFNWDPANLVAPAASPFIYPDVPGNPMHDFMIFRLATDALPQPPAG